MPVSKEPHWQQRIAALEAENEALKRDKYRLEEQLSAASDGTGLCIWEQHVPTGKLTIHNMQWGQMLGFNPTEVEANVESWKENLHPADKDEVIQAFMSHLAGESDFYQVVYRMIHKSGDYTWVSDRGRVVEFDDQGNPLRMMGSHIDITEEKQLIYTERERMKVVEARTKAKDDFMAIMSHELRTPMNAIVGLGALLKFSPLDKTQKKYIEKFEISCSYMMQLINNVLDFSKVKDHSFELNQQAFRLDIALRSVTNILELEAQNKGLTLSLIGESLLPEAIIGDRGHLSQVLINLVGNAIKYTEDGSVSLTVEPLDAPAEHQIKLEFSVTDTGVGIASEDIKNLFDPYQRVIDSDSVFKEGVGLGLAISKSLVELMGGNLQVESTIGQGSRFYFELVFELADEDTSSPEIDGTDLNNFRLPAGLHVLLTDDSSLNRYVGSEMIKNMGGTVSLASTGESAIVQLRQRHFDIVLMDISLPGKNGLEVTQWIRQYGRNPNVPILALTAHDITQLSPMCQEAGMNGYLSKPFEYQDLYRAICKALEETSTAPHANPDHADNP